MKLTGGLHQRVCDLDPHGIYGLRAKLIIPLPLLMSRLDTILNPQDNVISTLRPECVYYSFDEPS
jgi:hypothetical protein